MAEYSRSNWGISKTSQNTLDDYWEQLMYNASFNEREEIKFFLHSTTLKNKDRIQQSKQLRGGYTGLPARAPLASNQDMVGVWLAPSFAELPGKSPYGSQRLVMKVRDLMTFLSTCLQGDGDSASDNDRWDGSSDEETGRGSRKTKKREKKKKKRPAKKNQKECYTAHKEAKTASREILHLFFECAHFYGDTQYVRLILIRDSDDRIFWCRGNLKEIDIHDNPFLEYKWGRMFTYTRDCGRRSVVVELLVVGDILLDKVADIKWDTVGTASRAGYDPRLGVL